MRPHGTQEQLERRRRRAVEMLQNGMSLSAIAQKLMEMGEMGDVVHYMN